MDDGTTETVQCASLIDAPHGPELRALLGEPDDAGGTSRTYKVPSIWKHGEVEVAFSDAKSEREAESHGLWLAYVDDSYEGTPRPFIKLLGPDAKRIKSFCGSFCRRNS